jgi:hypothetical protein
MEKSLTLSTDLQIGDYAVFKNSPDIHTADVYKVVRITTIGYGPRIERVVMVASKDGKEYPVTDNQLIRVAGPVMSHLNFGEEPDIVY